MRNVLKYAVEIGVFFSIKGLHLYTEFTKRNMKERDIKQKKVKEVEITVKIRSRD